MKIVNRHFGVGSPLSKRTERYIDTRRREKSFSSFASEDNIDWSSLGLKSNKDVDITLNAARNHCTQSENGWSVPQNTVAIHYNKSIRAKPALAAQFGPIQVESAKFISLWESRGYVTLHGPIGTAKCIFGICSWITTGVLPRLRELIDDQMFNINNKTEMYHIRRRIIQFIATSLHDNVAIEFTGYVSKPDNKIDRQLFVSSLRHMDTLIPAFQCSEMEEDGYVEVPDQQTTFSVLKRSFMFSVLENAKDFIKEQIYGFFSHYGSTIAMVAIGGVVCIVGFALLIPRLARVVCKWAMGEQVDDVPEQQGDEENYIPVISDVTRGLTKYMGGPLGNVNLWSAELSKAGTQLRNIEYLMTFLVTKFSTIIDFVSLKIFGSPFLESSKRVLWANDELPKLELELENIQQKQLTRISSKRVIEIFKEFSKQIRVYIGLGAIANAARNAVETVSKMFMEMFKSACQSVYSPKMRVEPVWLHILGPPDMGKSTFSYALSATVLRELYGTYEQSDVYPVNEENTYWDGFYGQKVLFIDEHLAKGDTQERSTRAEKMIHVVNSMPYPLISAGLEDKGKHWIESDLVITTNNDTPYPSNLGLKDPNAYFRRRSVVIELIKREGDDYTFKMYPSKPPPSGLNTVENVIVSGSQVTKMVLDLINDKRQVYEQLKDKCTEIKDYDVNIPFLKFRGRREIKEDVSVAENENEIDGSQPPRFKKPPYTHYAVENGKLKGVPTTRSKLERREAEAKNSVEQQMYQPEPDDNLYWDGYEPTVPDHTNSSFSASNTTTSSFVHNRTKWKKTASVFQRADCMVANTHDWSIQKNNGIAGLNNFATSYQDASDNMLVLDYRWFEKLVNNSTLICKKKTTERIVAVSRSWKDQAWSYSASFVTPYHQTGEDIPLCNVYLDFPHHLHVVDSPYNRQHWAKFCKHVGVAVLPFDVFLTLTENKITYGELQRLYDTTPQKDTSSLMSISLNSRMFLARWFFATSAIFGLFCSEELLAIPEVIPEMLPYEVKSPKAAYASLAEIWSSKYGISREIVDKLRDPLFVIGGVVAIGALTSAAIAIINWLTSSGAKINTDIEMHSDNKHLNNVLKKTLRANRRQRKKQQTLVVEAQSDDTVQFHSLNMGLTDKVANNVEHIVIYYDDGSQASQFVTFLYGNKFVTSSHAFLRKDRKVVKIVFSFAMTMPYETTIDNIKFKFDEKRDLAFCVAKNFPVLFANVTKQSYLRTRESRPSPGTTGAIRIQFTTDGSLHLIQGPAVVDYNGPTGDLESRMNLVFCYKVGIGGKKGMCGLPYIFDNTNVGFLGGVHVAGTDDFSIFSPIFKEDIDEYFESPDQQSTDPIELADFIIPDHDLLVLEKPNAKKFEILDKPGACPLGVRTVAESNHYFVGPSTTKLRKSIVGVSEDCPFENNLAPAALKPFENSNGDKISPLNVAFKKFERKMLRDLPPEFFEPDVVDGIFTPDKPWDRLRYLTMEEAINGVPEWGNCHPIDMTTSAGVGYVNQGILRKDLFTLQYSKRYGRDIYVPKWVLKDQIEQMYIAVRSGQVPRCLALGLLKDEKRPQSRVEVGASRLFYAADLAHLIVSRMVCGGLLSAGEVNPSQSDIMVGINPLGVEWKLLYDRITHKEQFQLTSTDIEGWDINFCMLACEMFIQGMKHKFPKLSKLYIRSVHCILKSSVNPFVFIGNKVFWMWIMCSGCLLTSYFNSCANSMIHRALFKILIKEHLQKIDDGKVVSSTEDYEWLQNVKFDDAVKAGFFGDDNTQGVDKRLKDVYNGQTLSEVRLKFLNWITTDPFKKHVIAQYDKYEDTVLLKRFFRKDGPFIKGALDKKAIEGIAMWYMKGTNPDTSQQAINIHVALRESYFWGEDYFNDMLAILQPYLVELSKRSGVDHTFKYNYKQLDNLFLADM